MTILYDLWFEREYDDRDDTQLHIGVYAAHDEATAAIESLKSKPGFVEYPEGFQIYEVQLGLTGWTEGYRSTIGPPPKDAAGEVFDLPAWLDDENPPEIDTP